MALIFPGATKCPLCGDVIRSKDEVVATSAFIGDKKDTLWQYSDAAFHRKCFLDWDRRAEFVKRFNDVRRERIFGHCYQQMQDDGSIIKLPA
jgi:hypothetical protein